MRKKMIKKPFVYRSTIWNSVGGGLSYANESKICKIGKHKILLTRSPKLNYHGNPVHTATYIEKDGTITASVRGTGSATTLVSSLLRKKGIETKY